MNTKLFKLHEALDKHVFVPLAGRAGICSCGFLFYANTSIPLCGYARDVLNDKKCVPAVRDYVKLLKYAVKAKIPRHPDADTSWSFLRKVVEEYLLKHK